MNANVKNFAYENCSGGGRIKDYGVMQRAIRIQDQDRYYPIDARRAFWDTSYALHPMQIATLSGSWSDWQASGSVYEFRSASLGVPIGIPMRPTAATAGPSGATRRNSNQAGREHLQNENQAAGADGQPVPHSAPARRQGVGWHGVLRSRQQEGGSLHLPAGQSAEPAGGQVEGARREGEVLAIVRGRFDSAAAGPRRRPMGAGLAVTLPQPFSSDIIFLQDMATDRQTGGLRPKLVDCVERTTGQRMVPSDTHGLPCFGNVYPRKRLVRVTHHFAGARFTPRTLRLCKSLAVWHNDS